MPKRQIFYSFHYDNDVMRVQQIRNMGTLEGNKPVSPNEWETIQKNGEKAVEKWIDENIKNKSCVVVLIGEDTAKRKYVKYEIKKAWKEGKGLLGIYIHNLKDPKVGTCTKGNNPFEQFTFKDKTKLSTKVECYNPDSQDAYNDIKNNISEWIEDAINARS